MLDDMRRDDPGLEPFRMDFSERMRTLLEKGSNMDFKDISPELREKAMACKTPEEMLALAKAEGYRLSEEELAAVSGGGGWSKGNDNFCNPWV